MPRRFVTIALLCAAPPAGAQNWLSLSREQTEQAFAPTLPAAPEPARPDPTMTPGAVDTPQAVFCSRPSKERRHTTTPLSNAVADAYSVPRDDIGVRMQLDHLVPLSIGGATTAKNLWPQPMAEADVKDRCDRRIHDLVCADQVPAEEAQRAMAEDWVAACKLYMAR